MGLLTHQNMCLFVNQSGPLKPLKVAVPNQKALSFCVSQSQALFYLWRRWYYISNCLDQSESSILLCQPITSFVLPVEVMTSHKRLFCPIRKLHSFVSANQKLCFTCGGDDITLAIALANQKAPFFCISQLQALFYLLRWWHHSSGCSVQSESCILLCQPITNFLSPVEVMTSQYLLPQPPSLKPPGSERLPGIWTGPPSVHTYTRSLLVQPSEQQINQKSNVWKGPFIDLEIRLVLDDGSNSFLCVHMNEHAKDV